MFSLIIPCHNPEKTIVGLFNSLTMQGIPKEDLEIIVVDDNSDSLEYREILKKYDFNIVFCETDTSVHCPSNTRRKGMEYVTQDWVCFCDQDDFFEDNAFSTVKKYIEEADHTIYVVSTIMRSYDPVTKTRYKDYVHKQAWLHGKFYSVKNLIKPYGVNFKKDLVTHEDIYFNSLVLSHLYEIGRDWDYLNAYTYCWVDNPESITRRPTEGRGYLYENFSDYLVCAAEPFWNGAKGNIIFLNQVIMTLLHAYFYYEFASYAYGADDYVDVLKIIRKYLFRMIDDLGISKEYIIDYVYADPCKYYKVFDDCRIYCTDFIPKTSFRDFVIRLSDR